MKKVKVLEFNEKIDMTRPIMLDVGMKFANFKVFSDALKKYALENGIDYTYKSNEKVGITAICKRQCGWRIHASLDREKTYLIVQSFKNKEHSYCGVETNNKKVNTTYFNKCMP